MKSEKRKIWFSAMRYGVGWGSPVAWQGWVVYLLYFVLLFLGGHFLTALSIGPGLFALYVMFLSAVLIGVCWKKGEKFQFRWGDKEDDD